MIINFVGGLGSGKTIHLTWYLLEALRQGRVVYSNYKIFDDRVLNIDNVVSILDLKDVFMGVDDIIGWIDSRDFANNQWFTALLMACRKLRNDFGYSMQLDTGTDLRLRAVTDAWHYSYEVEFPVFGVEVYNVYHELIDEYEIEYKAETYDMYDTEEVVYQEISLGELKGLFKELGDKKLFSTMLKYRYNIPKSLGVDVFEFLMYDSFEFLEEIFVRRGFVVVD